MYICVYVYTYVYIPTYIQSSYSIKYFIYWAFAKDFLEEWGFAWEKAYKLKKKKDILVSQVRWLRFQGHEIAIVISGQPRSKNLNSK